VIIGAPFGDGPQTDQGSAYVFVRSGTVWVQQQRLSGADGTEEDQFGYSVGISGDRAVIGARTDSLAFFQSPNQGSAFVFRRANNTWTQQVKLVAADGSEGDLFGGAVAISGDTLVVGAASDDVNGITNQGSAYIFVFANNAWVQQAQLRAADGAANDFFGFSVAISGETVLVGATSDNVGANADQGSAYVFVRNGTAWSQQQQLFASNGTALDSFGNSVAINNGTAVVGAYLDDVGGNTNQGSAYVYEQLGTVWVQRQQLIGSPAAALDRFGNSVAISGDKIVVGAPLFDAAAADQGAAYFFQNVPSFVSDCRRVAQDHSGAGAFNIPLPLTGTPAVECRSSNGAHTLVFSFSNTVVSGSAAVTSGVGNIAGSPTFSGNTLTVNLTDVANVQQITITLSSVTDSFGQVLPPLPVSVNMLIGDTNGDRTVNAGDAIQTRSRSGQGTDATNFRNDVNIDGVVNSGDSLVGPEPLRHIVMNFRAIAGGLSVAVAAFLQTSTAQEENGRARAELLLEAMGGRAAWAEVKFLHVEAIHDDVNVREPFTNQIWNDFTAPRVRLEAKNAQIDRRRAIDGTAGWRWRDGEQSPSRLSSSRTNAAGGRQTFTARYTGSR
jgi:hypothetical protein